MRQFSYVILFNVPSMALSTVCIKIRISRMATRYIGNLIIQKNAFLRSMQKDRQSVDSRHQNCAIKLSLQLYSTKTKSHPIVLWSVWWSLVLMSNSWKGCRLLWWWSQPHNFKWDNNYKKSVKKLNFTIMFPATFN